MYIIGGVVLTAVLRIHRIHMILGLLDPDPDPFSEVWIRIRIWILLTLSKNSKKNLDFTSCFVTSYAVFQKSTYVTTLASTYVSS